MVLKLSGIKMLSSLKNKNSMKWVSHHSFLLLG